MAAVVACLNFKGGVGKTTISTHVASAIAQFQRKKVLLIDIDPQHNMTQLLFVDAERDKFFTSGKNAERLFLFGDGRVPAATKHPKSLAPSIDDVVIKYSKFPAGALDVVPGSFGLTALCIQKDPTAVDRANNMFRDFISTARGIYDYIFLDLNPGLSHLSYAAIEASDFIICPTKDDKYSPIGVRLIRDFIDNYFPEKLMRNDKLITVVMNSVEKPDYNGDTQVEHQIKAIKNIGPSPILQPRVPESFLLRNAHNTRAGLMFDRRVPLYSASKKNALVETFRELGKQFVSRTTGV